MKSFFKRLRNSWKFWRWPKRYLIGLFMVLLLIGWFAISAARGQEDPYRYATVESGTVSQTVSASGTVNGKTSAKLHFQTPGQLAQLNVKLGDQVQSDQLIASLDVVQQVADLNQAKNNYRSAQSAVDNVLDQISQYQYGMEIGPGNETMTQRQQRTQAQVTRDNAYDSINAAQDALNDSFLYAPISGTVTKTTGLPGQNVTTADTIAEIVDFNSGIVFEAEVDEADITKIQLGQPVDITLNSYGDQLFQGTVSEITPTTETTTAGATVIIVKIDLSNSGVQPIAGLNGSANIILQQQTDVLKIPQDAVRADDTVLVKTDQGTQPVKVTTGLESDSDVVITSGLEVGQEVVTNPPPPDQENPKRFLFF